MKPHEEKIMTTQIEQKAGSKEIAEKWGNAAATKFQQVPHDLFVRQVQLGLSPTEMIVLLNITMHWWQREKNPFPRMTTIARRMNVEPRTVQRTIKSLQKKGFVSKTKEKTDGGTFRQGFNMDGLINKLREVTEGKKSD